MARQGVRAPRPERQPPDLGHLALDARPANGIVSLSTRHRRAAPRGLVNLLGRGTTALACLGSGIRGSWKLPPLDRASLANARCTFTSEFLRRAAGP